MTLFWNPSRIKVDFFIIFIVFVPQQRYGYAQYRGKDNREKEPSASVMIRGLKLTTSAEMVSYLYRVALSCL